VFFWVIGLRRVVPVNEVHIVQTRKNTVSYGKGFESNTYYEWPTRLPLIGLTKVMLPVSTSPSTCRTTPPTTRSACPSWCT
jgi:flotillin